MITTLLFGMKIFFKVELWMAIITRKKSFPVSDCMYCENTIWYEK